MSDDIDGAKEIAKIIESKKGPWVYLMRDPSGAVKIGYSNDPKNRLTTVRAQMNEPDIELVHTIRSDNPELLEDVLHAKYEEYRVTGEWFVLPDEELDWLTDVLRLSVDVEAEAYENCEVPFLETSR